MKRLELYCTVCKDYVYLESFDAASMVSKFPQDTSFIMVTADFDP
jgi:hypothetical protein